MDGSLCSPGGEEGLETEDGGDGGGVICWGFEDTIAGGMGFVVVDVGSSVEIWLISSSVLLFVSRSGMSFGFLSSSSVIDLGSLFVSNTFIFGISLWGGFGGWILGFAFFLR